MSCRNCGEKKTPRHNPVAFTKDMDQVKKEASIGYGTMLPKPAPNNSSPKNPSLFNLEKETGKQLPPSTEEVFQRAKEMGIDDLLAKTKEYQDLATREIENAFLQMTDAMKQFHILHLLAIANYENLHAPGLSPEQALVGLKFALDREDFSKINDLYPTLKEQVGKRYEELIKRRIIL